MLGEDADKLESAWKVGGGGGRGTFESQPARLLKLSGLCVRLRGGGGGGIPHFDEAVR